MSRTSRACRLLTRAPRYALVGSNCEESTCRGWIPSMPLPFFIRCLAFSCQASCDQLSSFQHKHIVAFIDHEYNFEHSHWIPVSICSSATKTRMMVHLAAHSFSNFAIWLQYHDCQLVIRSMACVPQVEVTFRKSRRETVTHPVQ